MHADHDISCRMQGVEEFRYGGLARRAAPQDNVGRKISLAFQCLERVGCFERDADRTIMQPPCGGLGQGNPHRRTSNPSAFDGRKAEPMSGSQNIHEEAAGAAVGIDDPHGVAPLVAQGL